MSSPTTYPTETHRDTVKLCRVNCEFEFQVVQIQPNEVISVFLKAIRTQVPCYLPKNLEGELAVGTGE